MFSMMLQREGEHLSQFNAAIAEHHDLNTNGLLLTGSLSEEQHGSTDRSSATPSHNDENDAQDLLDDDVGDVKDETMKALLTKNTNLTVEQRLDQVDGKFVYIQHQLARIMRSMHVAPCMCEICVDTHRLVDQAQQIADPGVMLSSLFPNASPQQLQTLIELSKMNKLPSQVVNPAQVNVQQQQPRIGTAYAGLPGGGKIMANIPPQIDRKAVAEYAKVHGGAAAAKKFGVPPPVATYYQRKDSSNSLVPTTPVSATGMPMLPMSGSGNSATASPGPSSDGDREETVSTPVVEVPVNGTTGPPNLGQPMFTPQSMVDMLKMNAAHSTGSPGFLRGRGRGRPKLIGDELDADLVDYMVTVKQSDPHGHLTASQALQIAKQYILEKAPGLLEEHGGHVKLKLTWAMKLVSRIAERQKEIELGLPAGTLSNMGRQHLNNLPGGQFMADLMAQNILSQHMMMGLNPTSNAQANGGTPIKDESREMNEDNMNLMSGIASATPEIVNVKELNLPFLSNLFAGMSDRGGCIDGEIEQDDDDMNMSSA